MPRGGGAPPRKGKPPLKSPAPLYFRRFVPLTNPKSTSKLHLSVRCACFAPVRTDGGRVTASNNSMETEDAIHGDEGLLIRVVVLRKLFRTRRRV